MFSQFVLKLPAIFAGFLISAAVGQVPSQIVDSANRQPPRTVNRTVPQVSPPAGFIQFSAAPSTEEIIRCHAFSEPLVPIGDTPSDAENAALAGAILAYAKRTNSDDFFGVTSFLAAYPNSPWQASIQANLGLEYYNTGHYSKSIEAWNAAWQLSKGATERRAKAVADRAAGELSYMYARLGRASDLEGLFGSVQKRTFTGAATEKIAGAKQGLWAMRNTPEKAFRCGPLALDRIRAAEHPKLAGHTLIVNSQSTPNGFSLSQVAELSRKLEMNFQMAYRGPGVPFIVPSVVHWKVGHYAAVTRKQGRRFLLQDPTFGNNVWVTEDALNAEASGYFLVPPGALPTGWRSVDELEGQKVWGKGQTSDNDPDNTKPDDQEKDPPNSCDGMAVANAHLMVVSLNLTDTPAGYNPPVGPPVRFKVTYNQREANQPSIFTYSNLSQKWTFNWLAYITDNPSAVGADVQYYVDGGGSLPFTGYNPANGAYAIPTEGRMRLVRTSDSSYEMQFLDGSRKEFSQPDGSFGTSRKIFLTRVIDAAGNQIQLTYDANLRLVALTDAIGQVSILSYDNPNDPLLITKFTDPFGRFALFDYDTFGRLVQTTDTIGLTSQFTYGDGDFISALTTPYGVTTFAGGDNGNMRWLETTDPAGNTDRVEYLQSAAVGIPDAEPQTVVPAGMFTRNSVLWARNTFYWDKIAYAGAKGDYTMAKLYHWLHSTNYSTSTGIVESYKLPLENRVWYNYPGQQQNNEGASVVGSSNLPIRTGRVLDDGTTQLFQAQYNDLGKLTQSTDPLGRQTTYTYDTNEVDLLQVNQTTGAINDLLFSATYSAQHLPLTVTDASGQITSYAYNGQGQLLTVTNAKGEITTRAYDTSGYLTSIDGALPGPADTTGFTYDSLGRLHTATRPDGYTLIYDHDDMNRLTKITYPDSTNDRYAYTALDRTSHIDRAGRQTLYGYNSLRQLVSLNDPLNRMVRYDWCKCGDLKRLIDPMGRATTWRHDIQGRKTAKQYANGTTIQYLYENTTSRLAQKIDEKGQIKQYAYNLDNTVSSVSYPNAIIPTATVAYTYDPSYLRKLTMVDGIGTTTYSYNAVASHPTLGAGQLASVNGPWSNTLVTYQYDELGRVTTRAINGVAQTTVFDPANRITGVTNALGAFNYTYDGATRRPAGVSYPNGQSTSYSYYSNAGDHRLQQIQNLMPDQSVLSVHQYTYDAARRIQTWSQQSQADSPNVWTMGYDNADQLTSVTVAQGGATVHTYGYAYDAAANRTQETVDGTTNTFVYNSLNELQTSTKSLKNATCGWDAEQRLTSITSGQNQTAIIYDGLGRRALLTETSVGQMVSSNCYLWCGRELCEKRDATGSAAQEQYFRQGYQSLTGSFVGSAFFTRDHLKSIRELVDASGAVVQKVTYDPWGASSFDPAAICPPFAFSGYWNHASSGMMFSLTRSYAAAIGRWLSRDSYPMAELLPDGSNLYSYVGNKPIQKRDPTGYFTGLSSLPQTSNNLGQHYNNQFGAPLSTVINNFPTYSPVPSPTPPDSGSDGDGGGAMHFSESVDHWMNDEEYQDFLNNLSNNTPGSSASAGPSLSCSQSPGDLSNPDLSMYLPNTSPSSGPSAGPSGSPSPLDTSIFGSATPSPDSIFAPSSN